MSNNYEDGGVYFDLDDIMLNNDEDGGIYFNPEDEELIKDHLLPKLKTYLKSKSKDVVKSKSKVEDSKPKSKDEDSKTKSKDEDEDYDDFIEMKNVYDKEPWLLDHINNPLFWKDEWFYFVTRTQVSVKNIGRARNSKRRITGDNDIGSWKPNAKKYIKDEETKEVIGKKQTLKFTKSDNSKKKQKTGDNTSVVVPGSNSSWIMYEYSLPDEHTFQELVLCKIRRIRKSKDDDEDMEVTHNVEEEELIDKFARTGLDDQQQAPIYPLAQTSAPHPAQLGDKSLPREVDDDDEDEELMEQELDKHLF